MESDAENTALHSNASPWPSVAYLRAQMGLGILWIAYYEFAMRLLARPCRMLFSSKGALVKMRGPSLPVEKLRLTQQRRHSASRNHGWEEGR